LSELHNTNDSDNKDHQQLYKTNTIEEKFCDVLNSYVNTLTKMRKKPVMLVYYPDNYGQILDDDTETLFDQFRNRGFDRNNNTIEELDVLLHTLGGSPDAAYMMARTIRSFAKKVNFLIPYHAASAGTLLSFSGDKILFGGYSYITPIDIAVHDEEIGEISVMSIEYFMNFAIDCRAKMEEKINNEKCESMPKSNVESDLLVELVDQIDAITVGSLYRNRSLTEHYANLLLYDYMFKTMENSKNLADRVSHDIVFTFPAHEFCIDFHICKKIGLTAEELNENESQTAKDIVRFLNKTSSSGIICKKIGNSYRIPFIRLFT
jgi:hypothetical protein